MMQWERKNVEAEKAKLQEEMQSLKNKLEVTRVMLRRAENRLQKAEHDRDRYKRRIEALQGDRIPKTKIEELNAIHRNQLQACFNQIDLYKRLMRDLIKKKEGN